MPHKIYIRFYEELNDFLPRQQYKTVNSIELKHPRSVKDLIESKGVPHTEVELIIVNGKPVDFNYLVQCNDHISVYQAFTSLDISPLKSCQPPSPEEPVFVLDIHLGRLASYLRMLGFDTLYRNNFSDPELAEISATQQRILLSCDRQLLMRNEVLYGCFVRSRDPDQQVLEVMSRFRLYGLQQPFTRCMECNGQLQPVSKQNIQAQLLPATRKYYDKFYQCKSCSKIYWQGSHYQKMKTKIENLFSKRIGC